MNTEIIVAVIGLLGVIFSVLVTARSTQSKMLESQKETTNKLQEQNSIQNHKIDQLSLDIKTTRDELTTKIDSNQVLTDTKMQYLSKDMNAMHQDIQEHNHYAKLFSENVPVLQEKINVANKRIQDLENEVKQLRGDK